MSRRANNSAWLNALYPALITLCLVIVIIVLRRAWISDDALITFRTVDNFLNGYGLRWNILERVQTFTHPLWLLLVSGVTVLTGDVIVSAIVLAFGCLITLLFLLIRHAKSPATAMIALVALALSNAFVDYSTSGLENPLTFILLIAFSIIFVRTSFSLRDLAVLSLIASLALVNRLDTALFYVPALLYALLVSEQKPQAIVVMAIAQLPIIIWEIFSVIYYGFLFPNTYYAKVGIGIPESELWRQGVIYVQDSLFYDPVTLSVTAIGILSIWFGTQRLRKAMLAIGALLYILYVMSVGGDFMSGRFFAAPFIEGVFLISQLEIDVSIPKYRVVVGSLIVSIFILGLLSPLPSFQVGPTDGVERARPTGIADERVVWTTSGFNVVLQSRSPVNRRTDAPDVWSPDSIVDGLAVGLQGIIIDQQTHIIDRWAIGDPLMARLPAIYNPVWRVGHFSRVRPSGYEQTLTSGYNQLTDSDLAQYYEVLTLITRGNIWDSARLEAIWRINTGQYDNLIDNTTYRYPNLTRVTNQQLPDIFAGDTTVRTASQLDDNDMCPNGIELGESGILISLQDDLLPDLMTIGLNSRDFVVSRHRINFISDGDVTHSLDYFGNNTRLFLTVPDRALRIGYDQIHILPRVPLSFTDCITELTFYNTTDLATDIVLSLDETMLTDDLILIQSSPLWERGLLDEVANQVDGNIIYLTGVSRVSIPQSVTRANPYARDLHTLIRSTLEANQQIFYLGVDGDLPEGYPVLPLLMSESILNEHTTIEADLPLPLTQLHFVAPQGGTPTQFGDIATIIDWQIETNTVSACDTIDVSSLWYKSTPLGSEDILNNVALVLIDDVAVAQTDGLPAERNFESWSMREQYQDVRLLTVPCDLEAGEYQLAFIMYNYQSNAIVPMTQAGEVVADRLFLTDVTVNDRLP